MFKLNEHTKDRWLIVDEGGNHLHSEGNIYFSCPEYWPAEEVAQAVLDKFQPEHVWKHGDVFENCGGQWIYLRPLSGDVVVNLLYYGTGGSPEVQIPGDDTVFLFNIKDKLAD